MSTTLTNGIIIPDNGSRNWGGDLANNWNIIDLNVGYMADVKNSVTTLENSVAENTANIQINASNISALQTSKQDVIEDLETIRAGASLGATAVQPSELSNKANDSEVVHKSGDETINGTKLFTVSPICANSNATNGFFIRNDAIVRNEVPSQFYHHAFRVYDKSDQILGEFCVEKSTSGYSLLNMNVRSENDDGTEISKGLYLVLANDGSDVYFRPSTNNEFSLGTSTNKWKTLNGINPGALSLPNYAQNVAISFAVETPISIPLDGFLSVTMNVENYTYVSVIVNDHSVCTLQSALKPTVGAFIPVSANDIVKIHVFEGAYTGYGQLLLYQNKGNV